jgi:hypothetical protein
MKTVVETFIIEETQELIYDNEKLDKWNEMVKTLDLKGQTEIVKPDKSPIPFMNLKSSFINILETLCPVKVDVKKYNRTPIPVEILDLIGLSINEEYFTKIEIWYDDKAPDPVCVGILGYYYISNANDLLPDEYKENKFSTEEEARRIGESIGKEDVYYMDWNVQKYLLGKWGDVKRSFDELRELAEQRYRKEKEHNIKDTIKRAERELLDLDSEIFNRFN